MVPIPSAIILLRVFNSQIIFNLQDRIIFKKQIEALTGYVSGISNFFKN